MLNNCVDPISVGRSYLFLSMEETNSPVIWLFYLNYGFMP